MAKDNDMYGDQGAAEICYICGNLGRFHSEEGNSLREARCTACGASMRNSDTAKITVETITGKDITLKEAFNSLQDFNIYEAQSTGPIHDILVQSKNYVFSEYFNSIVPGTVNEQGIRCEDLQKLSFEDNFFDLVITQDVFEHVREPKEAFSEIWRVLKPNGYHIFTVPYHEGRKTLKRTILKDGKDEHLLPPIYHLDPLNNDGILVYTDFGDDLISLMDSVGFDTKHIILHKWYHNFEIPYINNDFSYKMYLKFKKNNNILNYLKYNSVVFSAKKVERMYKGDEMLEWTGERYLPYLDPMITGPEIHYEHIHRYAFAGQFVKDKNVLDLGSGEGYGSFMLSEQAKSVVGIDIDKKSVVYSSNKYKAKNLDYIWGSILDCPLNGKKQFDLIVCFETIEHVIDHKKLIDEVKRLLKDDGIFIVSTPNKNIYNDMLYNTNNKFHVKELNYEQLMDLLHRNFSDVRSFGQKVFIGSSIWRMNSENTPNYSEFLIDKEEDRDFSFIGNNQKVPVYILAIASNANLANDCNINSFLIDKSNNTIKHFNSQIAYLNDQLEVAINTAQNAIKDAKKLQLEIVNREDRIAALEESQQTSIRTIGDRLKANYQTMILDPTFPRGTRRRDYYDMSLKAGYILSNFGIEELLMRIKNKLNDKNPLSRMPLIENDTRSSSNQIPLTLDKKISVKFVFPSELLNEIRIYTATFRRKNSNIIFTISDSLAGTDLREVVIKGRRICDNDYTRFKFEPIENSAGKTYYFSIKSDREPYAAVWYDKSSATNKNQLYIDNKSVEGSISFQAFTQLKLNSKYETWIMKNEPMKDEFEDYKTKGLLFPYRPKISIITPVWNTEGKWLNLAIESVLNQVYDNWELCIADGGSTNLDTKKILEECVKKDPRIKVKYLPNNKGISGNSNEALSIASGEFVAFLDHDDELSPFAMFEVVEAINKHLDVEFIYSDRDKITDTGKRIEPFFKPDWSPEYLLAQNYLCHLNVVKKDLIDRVGWFKLGYEGSQDYDLFLRLTDQTSKIIHIPKILYHWRVINTSAASGYDAKPYAIDAAIKALQDSINRRGWNAVVTQGNVKGLYRLRFQIEGNPKVSIIIPTKDKAEVLKKCIDSILIKTTYDNYEIVIVDNNSQEKETRDYYKSLESESKIKMMKYNEPFNFQAINNYAVSRTDGKYILFLNNDIEVITAEWLEIMLGFAMQKNIGAVGIKLLYPNGKIQHAGLILDGKGNVRRSHHCFSRNSLGYAGRIQSIQDVSAVAAACMMMRRDVFEEVGGFDTRFVVAHGDIDLCLKIIQKNYRVVYEPHAELYHYESLSRGYDDTKEKIERLNNETRLLLEKWSFVLEKGDPYYSPNLTAVSDDFSIKI